MNFTQVAVPSLLGVADGIATPMSIEALDFSPDSSQLLVKVSFLDDAYLGVLRSAVWVYDIATASYGTDLNVTLKAADPLLASPDVSSAVFSNWQGQNQVLALLTDAAGQAVLGGNAQNHLALIRNGVVIDTDLIQTIAGAQANQLITALKVTDNGRYAVIETAANNLLADTPDTNGVSDIFLLDLQAKSIQIISTVSGAESLEAAILGDVLIDNQGALNITFSSTGNFTTTPDTNALPDVFLWKAAGANTTLSTAPTITLLSKVGNTAASGDQSILTQAGTLFQSSSDALTPLQDSNGANDVFLSASSGTISLVSPVTNSLTSGASLGAASLGGRYVAELTASPEIAGATGVDQLVVIDRTTGTQQIVSKIGGVLADDSALSPMMSANGQLVAFSSQALNLQGGIPSPDMAMQLYLVNTGNAADIITPISATTTSRYTLLGSGANFMDFSMPYGNLSLDGQNMVFKGNSGVDSVYVGSSAGMVFDFTQAGLDVDQIYLSGKWADYSGSYSGSVVTLTRANGGAEIIKAISSSSNGDNLIFADGTVPVVSELSYLKSLLSGTPLTAPIPDHTLTSTAFPIPSTGLSNTVRAVVQDATGETIALSHPGVNMIVKGGSGVDVVYVATGTTVDGTQLGLGQDKIYLTGNWSDYSGTVAGSVVTLTHGSESVKFLGGSLTAYDSIIFADGTASSYDILMYEKATTHPQLSLNTAEVTPLGTGSVFTGTAGIDTLTGTANGDVLYGHGGKDIINGFGGNDTIIITDAGTTDVNSATILITAVGNGIDTVLGFNAAPVANGGDVLDFSAIAHLTASVATGQTVTTNFGANNVFIFDGTATTIGEAAKAIAADATVVAGEGYIVIKDSANHDAVTVYHSNDLNINGADTALVILSGVDITQLTAANIVV